MEPVCLVYGRQRQTEAGPGREMDAAVLPLAFFSRSVHLYGVTVVLCSSDDLGQILTL